MSCLVISMARGHAALQQRTADAPTATPNSSLTSNKSSAHVAVVFGWLPLPPRGREAQAPAPPAAGQAPPDSALVPEVEKEKLVGGYLAPPCPKLLDGNLLLSEKACEVAAGEVRSRVMVG